MAKGKPVVCLGILVADVIGRPVRTMPDPGRLVLIDEMGLFTGGCAANAATALARLGLPVEVIGRVGLDPFGDFLVCELEQRGIGTRGVSRDPEIGTSATMVLVDLDGERCFVHYIGANACLRLEDVDLAAIRSASILHVAGSLVMPGLDGEPTALLLQRAKSAGVITFLDTVWDDTGRWMQRLASCLPYVDYFVPSLAEAQALTGLEEPGDMARSLLDRGVQTVALKMGSAGCLVMTNDGGAFSVPAFAVNVVDATGAGDAFAAGFIAGVWLGYSLEQTARFANAVGALCVTGVGATGNVTSLPETLAFIESAKKS
ncbi:MAG: carbohydrate kinase family protein [Anaerolineae bacterium]|nr:carbohydrate kinase family protein [Anaerolineae bacterium]